MAANRRNKRRKKPRSNKANTRKSGSPSGWFVIGFWAVTFLLIGVTKYDQQTQMEQKGYAHLSVNWIIILLALILIAITFTVQCSMAGRQTSEVS